MAFPGRTGKVKRLWPTKEATYIQLDIDRDTAPTDENFTLDFNHPNYHALYSLALAAAANRWPLTIRVTGAKDQIISPANPEKVEYMFVDW